MFNSGEHIVYHLLDEQYTGATQTPQPTGTAPGATTPKSRAVPPGAWSNRDADWSMDVEALALKI